jgi:hypothetical protein
MNKTHLVGRVVDLKKINKEKVEDKTAVKKSAGFSISLSLFLGRPKKSPTIKTNFLKSYKDWQKREEFIENEFWQEFATTEKTAEKAIKSASGLFFISRFIVILIKRLLKIFFSARKKSKPILIFKKEKREKKFGLAYFFGIIGFFFLLIKSLFFSPSNDNYFCREALLKKAGRRSFRPLKNALVFFILAAAVLLPFKAAGYLRVLKIDEARAKVVSASERAIANLRLAAGAAESFDLPAAEENFGSAKENFSAAKEELADINSLLLGLGKYAPNEEIRLASYGREIISAGEAAASAGENLSQAGDIFVSATREGKTFSEAINDFIVCEKKALNDINSLNSYLEKIDRKALPVDYRQNFDLLKEKGEDLKIILSGTIELLGKLNIFLGAESDKRYLFVFENNREMRATGGFIGSFALVDFSRGRLKNIEVPPGGSYDTEGGLLKKIISPEPLWLVNPLWHFWDANWWPDWKISAKKLAWFYEKSDGPTVDGVVAFTPTVLENLLKTTGPIDMTQKYGVVMDSENLWENLRVIIEKEKTAEASVSYELAEKKPKKIVGELFSVILSELPKRIDKEKAIDLFLGVTKNLEEKQILLYFNDDKLQTEAEKNNFAGRIRESSKDYLMVVNTNIAGGKSDGKMKEEISHQAEILADGSVINTLTIKRIHQGQLTDQFYGVRNVNWMRIYVPLGSQLLEASGFRGPDPIYFSLPEEGWKKDIDVVYEEGDNAIIDKENLNTKIYKESGKTVFANWSMIDPGQEAVIVLKYKLPFKLEKKIVAVEKKSLLDWALEKTGQKKEKKDLFIYSLLAQKQAGSLFTSLDSSLIVAPEFNISWQYPENSSGELTKLFSGDLATDIYVAVILEKDKLQ